MEYIKVKDTDLFMLADNPQYLKLKEKHPNAKIEPVAGTEVELAMLKDNEAVCYGDGVCYHFLITE